MIDILTPQVSDRISKALLMYVCSKTNLPFNEITIKDFKVVFSIAPGDSPSDLSKCKIIYTIALKPKDGRKRAKEVHKQIKIKDLFGNKVNWRNGVLYVEK